MTAGDTQGRAWSQWRAAVTCAVSLRAAILVCLSFGLAAESIKLVEVIRGTLSPSREPPASVQARGSAAHAGGIDLKAILGAHLFGRYDPATRQDPTASGNEELSLSGILFFSGNDSLSRIMLSEYPKTAFAVGDRVTGDVVVGAISPRYAILSDGGRQRILRLTWRRNPGATAAGNGNFNDDLDASNDDSSKPPPILEPYADPVGDG